jgi:uncharacterized protein YeaO (DUF488 family)
MTRAPVFQVRRVYGDSDDLKGYRVLVDRLWPRGIKKSELTIDEWPKDVAPSTELRRWYGHDPDLFDEFARRYRKELGASPGADVVAGLIARSHQTPVILLTATRDVEHSGARVLEEYLVRKRRATHQAN